MVGARLGMDLMLLMSVGAGVNGVDYFDDDAEQSQQVQSKRAVAMFHRVR